MGRFPPRKSMPEYIPIEERVESITSKALANLHIAEGENSKALVAIIETKPIAATGARDPVVMKKAYHDYLAYCAEHDMRVGNMAAYRAIGIGKDTADMIMRGKMYAKDPRFKELVEEIKSDMAMYREYMANHNQVNVAWSIFSAKNFDGLRDTVEIAPVTTTALDEARSGAAIAEEYADIIQD